MLTPDGDFVVAPIIGSSLLLPRTRLLPVPLASLSSGSTGMAAAASKDAVESMCRIPPSIWPAARCDRGPETERGIVRTSVRRHVAPLDVVVTVVQRGFSITQFRRRPPRPMDKTYLQKKKMQPYVQPTQWQQPWPWMEVVVVVAVAFKRCHEGDGSKWSVG